MHFDQREQAALREVGLSTDDLQEASQLVADAVDETATVLESFFDERDVVYSDMDLAHSAGDSVEHQIDYLDTYTHAADLHGWLRFDSWGATVEDGRVLSDDVVELTLVGRHGRTRFATDPEVL